MQIERWMSRKVHCARPLDSILHAREIMVKHRVNQLPVVVDGRLVGIITDRDLRDAFPSVFDSEPPAGRARRAHAGADPASITVELVMTPAVTSLKPGDTIADAARRMREDRIGAIPIIDAGRLVGIITRSDLLDALIAISERA